MCQTTWRALLVATTVSAVGCGSSTGGPTTSQCEQPPVSTDDPRAAAVIAFASGHHVIDGTWLNGRTASVATIDLTVGDKLADSTTGCGGTMRVDATAIVKTRDGLIDVRGTVLKFQGLVDAHLDVPLPDLPDAFAHPDAGLGSFPHEGVRPTRTTTPTLVLSFTAHGMRADVVVDDERAVGTWSWDVFGVPARAVPVYAVPPELVDTCAPAADYVGESDQYTPFASAADARAAMPGAWTRCRANGGPAHAGIQISDDGTWRYLSWEDGAFITSPGLRREGTMSQPIDTHSLGFNGAGYYQVDLVGAGVWHSSVRWRDILIMDESVYVRSARAVTEAMNRYAAGDRAGRAACAVPEAGTIDPDLGAELGAALAGEWTVCSGESLEGYTRLRFDGQNGVKLLDDNGTELASRVFRALHPETMPPSSPRVTALIFGEEDDWTMLFSQRPLKLWVSMLSPHAVTREMMFSAQP